MNFIEYNVAIFFYQIRNKKAVKLRVRKKENVEKKLLQMNV